MRRTYRSKKDTGSALDHRDVLLNMDEKSSAFDAFYIENLKQTKRELSCIVPSNQAKMTSNKVRKRKYVKRLVKDVEPVRQRETSTSGYLTPDKSIRVNKILDPFDMLLNSSPALREPSKPEISEAFGQKKESKTYQRKRKPKIKKFNASLDSTGSQKENTTDTNTTDIGTHELLIEKVPNSNKFSKCVDESINKIINNLSLINNLKHKGANGSFKTSYKTKNRLTKNYQSPLMQKSPYCSTPFKEKYRGVSIYNFSPIIQREQINSTREDKDESNHSIILVSKSLALKKSNEFKVSPLIQEPNITAKNKIHLLVNHSRDNSSIEASEVVQNEIDTFDSQNQNDTFISINEQSSCQITDTEPFLGFSNNGTNNFTEEKMRSMLACLDNPSLHDDFGGNNLVSNNSHHTVSSNINTDEKKLRTNKSKCNNLPLMIDENDIATKSDLDSSLSNTTDNDSENSSSNIDISKIELESNKKKSFDSSSVNFNENELEPNDTSNDGFKNITTYSIDSNICNISRSKTLSQSSDSESLYDTCSSDQSSILDDENRPNKELIVEIEKMNDSIFLKYYAKMVKSQDKEMSDQTDNEDFVSFASDSNNETLNESKGANSDSDQITAIVITDSFTTDDVAEDLNNDVNERYISFVTTRRRNEVPKDSMFQFDQSYGSSSTDCDKTVLSINLNIGKPSNNINVEDVSESNLSETNIDGQGDYKDSKTDNVQNKILLRKSSRKSRILNKSDATSPLLHHDFKSRNPANEVCMINTRRGSRISRQGIATNIVGPICDTKLFENETNRRISRISMRKSSKLLKSSHFTSREKDNNGGEKIFKNFDDSDKTVNENNISDKSCIDFQIRDSKSPLPPEEISYTLKENIVTHPERLSFVGADVKPAIVLHPGKKWERSLSIYRRMTMVADHCDHSVLEDDSKQNKGRKYRQSVISTMEMQEYKDSLHNDSINSRRSTFVSNPGRPSIRFVKDPNFSRVSLNTSSVFDDLKGFLSEECDDTVIELSKLSIAGSEREVTVLDNFHETERVTTARDYVLRRCNQTEPLLFDECFPETVLKNCHKIGEGVYGEVFLWRGRDGRARVMKIVPIAGTVKVNGEHQKDFHEIISEIVIAMELSALRAPIADIERQLDEGNDINAVELHAIENATDIFNEVLAVRCVFGPYPSRLLDLWELYDECKGSENDNPASLPADQRYIVLELANAGQDLESYQFASAQQAYALFQQIAFGLAVAEEAFQFEHRDLHWGNVLIAPTEQKFATFVLRGRTYRVPRRGVAATVIDYSLSRLSLPLAGECAALYNDLAADEQLFDAVGDYQFELYRLMRDKLGNDWKNFEPYTNILWLHYTVDKMITALRYKRTNTKIHKHYIEKLKGIKNSILEYGSTVQYVLTDIDF